MSISGGASVGLPFQQSINGVRDVDGEVEQLPNRRKLAPINGAKAESKLSELFTPVSIREVHLEKILTPPKIGAEVVSPDTFRQLLSNSTDSLRNRDDSSSDIIQSALAVLENIEENRELIEIEFNRLLDA